MSFLFILLHSLCVSDTAQEKELDTKLLSGRNLGVDEARDCHAATVTFILMNRGNSFLHLNEDRRRSHFGMIGFLSRMGRSISLSLSLSLFSLKCLTIYLMYSPPPPPVATTFSPLLFIRAELETHLLVCFQLRALFGPSSRIIRQEFICFSRRKSLFPHNVCSP